MLDLELKRFANNLKARDMRSICEALTIFSHVDRPEITEFVAVASGIRLDYIKQVGVRHYVHNAIGQDVHRPAVEFDIYDNRNRKVNCIIPNTKLLNYLSQFRPEHLPRRVRKKKANKRGVYIEFHI